MKNLYASVYKINTNGSKGETIFEDTIGCNGEITFSEFSEIKARYIAFYGEGCVGFGLKLK